MDKVVSHILEKQVLSLAKAVEEKLDEEITALERLDPDDIEVLWERRIQQMHRADERRSKWRALGHGEYDEIPEKEFFSAAKASERLVCHFYHNNWPCKSNVVKFEGHVGPVTAMSFSKNGYFLAAATLDGVNLWDLRKFKKFQDLLSL